MEYCEGGSLRELISAQTLKNGLPQMWKILTEILLALNFMHEGNAAHPSGFIHRDIKPVLGSPFSLKIVQTNILLTAAGVVKLADLGLVTEESFHQLSSMTAGAGTPLYMAPEVLIGEKYTNKIDIFSLGMVFFEIIASFAMTEDKVHSQMNVVKMKRVFPDSFGKDILSLLDLLTVQSVIIRMTEMEASSRPSAYELLSNSVLPFGSTLPGFPLNSAYYGLERPPDPDATTLDAISSEASLNDLELETKRLDLVMRARQAGLLEDWHLCWTLWGQVADMSPARMTIEEQDEYFFALDKLLFREIIPYVLEDEKLQQEDNFRNVYPKMELYMLKGGARCAAWLQNTKSNARRIYLTQYIGALNMWMWQTTRFHPKAGPGWKSKTYANLKDATELANFSPDAVYERLCAWSSMGLLYILDHRLEEAVMNLRREVYLAQSSIVNSSLPPETTSKTLIVMGFCENNQTLAQQHLNEHHQVKEPRQDVDEASPSTTMNENSDLATTSTEWSQSDEQKRAQIILNARLAERLYNPDLWWSLWSQVADMSLSRMSQEEQEQYLNALDALLYQDVTSVILNDSFIPQLTDFNAMHKKMRPYVLHGLNCSAVWLDGEASDGHRIFLTSSMGMLRTWTWQVIRFKPIEEGITSNEKRLIEEEWKRRTYEDFMKAVDFANSAPDGIYERLRAWNLFCIFYILDGHENEAITHLTREANLASESANDWPTSARPKITEMIRACNNNIAWARRNLNETQNSQSSQAMRCCVL